ncbi:hypothetical protein DBV05_g11064 [Lasiodiplodia theobromae]|uniref:Uncharacterized protein n=1 Tax=Lasiodiplodia theobromae TaxID=45133 RepID=A0A5N5CYB4_9PEZI|nr:hypothetical protein DBV05_g11064 [Lasiodiplodia theobromae]
MDNRDGYGPVNNNIDDATTLQGDPRRSSMATERDQMFGGGNALKEASSSVMNAMAAPSGRTSMSTTRTSRAIEHFDGNPNIPPYESIAEDPEYNRGPSSKKKLPPPGWIHFLDQWNEWWIGEIVCVLLALGAFGVVIWIFVDADGKKLADWGPSISPNAMVSTFITIARFLMVAVVAECIGQLRWLYFQPADRKPRELADLDLFDGAARGPIGSVKLLFRMQAKALIASFAALVVVVALAVDPFAQQILSFPSRIAPLAVAANDTWFPAAQALEADSGVLSSANLRKTIFSALLGVEEQQPAFGCPTGNCTWENAFASLGLCSSCEDLSSSVTPTCANASTAADGEQNACPQLTYTLADYHNLTLVLQNGSFVEQPRSGALAGNALHDEPLGQLYTLVRSVAGEAYPAGVKDPRLFEFAVAQLDVGVEEGGQAWDADTLASPKWNVTACAVRWCAKVYEDVEVRNGQLLNAEPRDVELTASSSSDCWSSSTCQEFQATNSSSTDSNSTSSTFTIALTNDTTSPFAQILSADFNITLSTNRTSPTDTDEAAQITAANNSPTTALYWQTDIATAFDTLATSFSNLIRSSASSSSSTSNSTTSPATNSSSLAFGTPLAYQTFIAVSWPWFALPALIMACGVILLVICVVLTHLKGREKVMWKASSLPLLLLSPPRGEWREEEWRKGRGKGRVGVVTRTMQARLGADEKGVVRFVKN